MADPPPPGDQAATPQKAGHSRFAGENVSLHRREWLVRSGVYLAAGQQKAKVSGRLKPFPLATSVGMGKGAFVSRLKKEDSGWGGS